MKFTTILSLSFLLPGLTAQEAKKDCCAEGQKPEASCCAADAKGTPELAKELQAISAKVKALAAKDKAELQAAAKLAADSCPISHASLQVLTVLHQAADAYKANPECCPATPSEAGHGAEAKAPVVSDHERLTNLTKTLEAHWALLAELGIKAVKPECCAEGTKAASCCDEGEKAADKAKAPSCCDEGKDKKAEVAKKDEAKKSGDCCAAEGTNKFIACASVTTTAVKAAAEKASKLDKAVLEKVAAADVQLEKLGIVKASQKAMAFYQGELKALSASLETAVARGNRAAEGGCPEGDGMKAKAETMAKVVKGLSDMTTAFTAVADKCCATGGGAGCCDDMKAKK